MQHFNTNFAFILERVTKDQNDFSMALERVLDEVGISEEIIKSRRDRWFEFEILATLRRRLKYSKNSVYVFGSQIEGTTLSDLGSDIDILLCNDGIPVVESISSAPTEGKTYLLCRNETTPAGYVRLKALENGHPIKSISPNFHSVEVDTVYVKNSGLKKMLGKFAVPLRASDKFVSGPAASFTSSIFGESYDFVGAFRCRQWPSFANSVFERPRPYNWPPPAIIETFKSLGCFVAPVGHPKSPQQETEFRISFSLQERMLMHSFNPVQLKCYVVLKLIKKEIITNLLGGKSLTSYHLKTCMFYLLEQTEPELWTTGRLMFCVQQCLEQLLLWVTEGICPNYFIPEENMFDRHVHGIVKDKLQCILKNLLCCNFSYIYDLKTNRIGDILDGNNLSATCKTRNEMSRQVTKFQILGKTLEYRICEINRLLHVPTKKTVADLISFIDQTTLKFSQIDTVTEHSEEETAIVKNRILPYLKLNRLCNLMADACRNKAAFDNQALVDLNIENDCLTPMLKYAMFLFQMNQSNSCLQLLQELEKRLGSLSVSVCGCSAHQKCQILLTKMTDCALLKSDLDKLCFAPCISFLPTEDCLLPLPLRCEIASAFGFYYKVGLLTKNREQFNFWLNWVFIDGKFLLYFMLFLAADHLNRREVSADAIQKMKHVTDTDPDLGHKETCLNVLGCVFKQRGFMDSALGCFLQSYKLRPRLNTTVLHIMSLLADRI